MPTSEVDNWGHLQNEIWLINDNTNDVLEMGLGRHCTILFQDGTGTCTGHGGYAGGILQFWAETVPGQYEYFHSLGAVSSDGSNHSYEIWDGSNGANNTFNIYLDFNKVGASAHETDSSGTRLNAGIEEYSPSGDNSNEWTDDRFHNYVQDYRNAVGAWDYVDFDTTDDHTYDGQCGTTQNCVLDECADYPNGLCFLGNRTSNYEWSDYKPS